MGLLINIDMVKLILLLAFFCVGCSDTFNEGSEKIVYNGIPWFDDQGNIVNAHGGRRRQILSFRGI